VALFALALLARHGGKVLEMGLSIASVAYGSLLGVFLLGTLTRRASEHGAMVGMLFGFVLNIYLWQFTKVAFTWYVVFGSVVTFLVGYGASLFFPRNRATEKHLSDNELHGKAI
jgi:SSS family solute:Na+ symporter